MDREGRKSVREEEAVQKQGHTAEVRFTSRNICLTGAILKIDPETITLRLRQEDADPALLQRDVPAELIVTAKNTVYHAMTQVLSSRNHDVTLVFTAPIQALQRRRDRRIPCALDVHFRAIQEAGCFGAWICATTRDLSPSGVRLLVARGIEIPRRIELLIHLPERSSLQAVGALSGSDQEAASQQTLLENHSDISRQTTRLRPLKVSARAAYRQAQADGQVAVGLRFFAISPGHQMQILCFLTDPLLRRC